MSNYSRYKSKHSYNFNGLSDIIAYLAVLAIVVVVFFFGVNACTAKEWNGGKCPDCNVKYQLYDRDGSVRYYICPECDNEVSRYGGK